jgi:hypothetical protein
MTTTHSPQTEVVGTALKPSLQLPDAESIAENILTKALAFCADKLGLADAEQAAERLRGHDGPACSYCMYSIAAQAGESLGSLDEQVKAVYTLDYDATPGDLCFAPDAASAAPTIHLIVWTQRKTAALDALVAALDRALVGAFTDLLGQHGLAYLLDVQTIDDGDVETGTGYGALLRAIHNRPIQVWTR